MRVVVDQVEVVIYRQKNKGKVCKSKAGYVKQKNKTKINDNFRLGFRIGCFTMRRLGGWGNGFEWRRGGFKECLN